MKELEERIKMDGVAVSEDILKVDSFINHQVDPVLMQHIDDFLANGEAATGAMRSLFPKALMCIRWCASVSFLRAPSNFLMTKW